MVPYRIKHKATGLYYKPGKPNLSKIGKAYITGKNILNYNRGIDYIYIIVTNRILIHTLEDLHYNNTWTPYQGTFKIPKSEFEIEEIK